jgi:hypothetical protein
MAAIGEDAPALRRRVADLRAARTVSDLIGSALSYGSRAGIEAVTLRIGTGHELVFVANHPKNPVLGTGAVDWARVSRIKVVSIEEE